MKIKLLELRKIIRHAISELCSKQTQSTKTSNNVEENDDLEETDKEDDFNKDGKKDFTDVMASRMHASGLNHDDAIKKAEKTTSKHK